MKKILLLAVIAVFLVSGAAYAGVVGSKHDLTSGGGAFTSTTSTDEVCVFCHTPHSSLTSTGTALWNRNPSLQTFAMYTSPTIDMTMATSPQGVSAACLSCHDGATAFDTIINDPGSGLATITTWNWTNGNTMNGAGVADLGTDLRTEHPISITYDTTKDTDFNAINNVRNTLRLYGTGEDQVECGSCHDPHDTTNAPFLRISNTGSAICTTCHLK